MFIRVGKVFVMAEKEKKTGGDYRSSTCMLL